MGGTPTIILERMAGTLFMVEHRVLAQVISVLKDLLHNLLIQYGKACRGRFNTLNLQILCRGRLETKL